MRSADGVRVCVCGASCRACPRKPKTRRKKPGTRPALCPCGGCPAQNRRRSAGATPDFSHGTAYDFKFFLSRHKITGKRGAVADAHSGEISDGQN